MLEQTRTRSFNHNSNIEKKNIETYFLLLGFVSNLDNPENLHFTGLLLLLSIKSIDLHRRKQIMNKVERCNKANSPSSQHESNRHNQRIPNIHHSRHGPTQTLKIKNQILH